MAIATQSQSQGQIQMGTSGRPAPRPYTDPAATAARPPRPGTRPLPHQWFGKPIAPGKVPRKVNAFETMVDHQGMLEQKPLFPYLGPGDIVPTAALSLSLPGMARTHFYHYNDVPEVILCLASEQGLISTGQLYLQQGTHGVTSFLKTPNAPEAQAYQISLVIIRVNPQGPQNEAFILRCLKCNEVVFRQDRDIWPAPEHPYYKELAPIRFYADAADAFNATERVCPECGTVQPEFPVEMVGWRRYAQYTELANRARADMEAQAAQAAAKA